MIYVAARLYRGIMKTVKHLVAGGAIKQVAVIDRCIIEGNRSGMLQGGALRQVARLQRWPSDQVRL